MICRPGRHRSVANAELRSNTSTRYGRHQHSVSCVNLSELDFWKNTCAGKCSECSKQSTRIFLTHYDRVRAECSRLVSVEHWKRQRLENHSQSCATRVRKLDLPRIRSMKRITFYKRRRNERQVPRPHLMSRTRTMEFLMNWQSDSGTFMKSIRALADCVQTRNITRNTGQSMIETAKCMFHE